MLLSAWFYIQNNPKRYPFLLPWDFGGELGKSPPADTLTLRVTNDVSTNSDVDTSFYCLDRYLSGMSFVMTLQPKQMFSGRWRGYVYQRIVD